jgi:hypothetical protein
MTIVAEKAGTYYLPAIHLVGLRVQKELVIKQTQRVHLMLNIYNFFDVKTVTGVNQATGTFFNEPTININGSVVRLSARYTF